VRLIVLADPAAAARRAADEIGYVCQEAVRARGRALIAVSGGQTPWVMLSELRRRELPWELIHVAQVDERCAPRGDPQRNLTRLEHILLRHGPPAPRLWPMPVEEASLEQAGMAYQALLEAQFGAPLQFDLVQLGLGTDGHTASLVPGDAALSIADRDVAVTGPYQGLRRMTLTFPALSRARQRLWLVTGASKAPRLAQLLGGAGDIPALQVARDHTSVIADAACAPAPEGGATGSR